MPIPEPEPVALDPGPSGTELSLHERHQLAETVASLRSGDVAVAQQSVDSLFLWPLPRLYAAVQFTARRYMTLLTELGRANLSSVDAMSAFLDAVGGHIPEVLRPDQAHLFDALTLVVAERSEAAAERIRTDLPGATMSLLMLIVGFAGLGGRDVPATATLVAAVPFPTR